MLHKPYAVLSGAVRYLMLLLCAVLLGGCTLLPAAAPADTGAPAAIADYPAPPEGLLRAPVVRVVDGDTIDVRIDGDRQRVRLIGINTPESVDPRRPVECFGSEAAAQAEALLNGATVLLEPDPSQDDVDDFGRLLRFVWLEDGRLFNLEMIAQGYAFEYTYRDPYKYQRVFRAAERQARTTGAGLWAPETCDGQRRR
jgi:micrococcal nuclease